MAKSEENKLKRERKFILDLSVADQVVSQSFEATSDDGGLDALAGRDQSPQSVAQRREGLQWRTAGG
jgi:hypothetical protein